MGGASRSSAEIVPETGNALRQSAAYCLKASRAEEEYCHDQQHEQFRRAEVHLMSILTPIPGIEGCHGRFLSLRKSTGFAPQWAAPRWATAMAFDHAPVNAPNCFHSSADFA